MTIDVERARAETPGCREVLHLNNAGAALMPAPVLEAQVGHLELEARLGGYEAAEAAAPAIGRTYDALARLLGCGRDEIALVENATVGWDLALHSFRFQPGDRILTAEAEYASNYIAYLRLAERQGVAIEVVPSDESGQLSLDALGAMIDERVKLISISHVPTNGGLVNPAEGVGRIARAAGIPFRLDACQSAGQIDLDVERLGCDLLSASGRKYLRGPRGSGFLYVRRALLDRLEPPFLDLHGARWLAPGRYEMRPDARRFENWEFNYAAVIGLGAAVDYALAWGLPAIEGRVAALGEALRRELAGLPGARVHDLGMRRCGIVSFTLDVRPAEQVRQALAARRINVSVSSRDSTRIDMERRGLGELLRASVHYYNTEDELARFREAVAELKPVMPRVGIDDPS
jgi:selenocysteine lyase/cysteine desulfurase